MERLLVDTVISKLATLVKICQCETKGTWFAEPSKSEGTLTINFSSPYLYGETKGTRTPNLFRDREAL